MGNSNNSISPRESGIKTPVQTGLMKRLRQSILVVLASAAMSDDIQGAPAESTTGAALGSKKLKQVEQELNVFGQKLPGNPTIIKNQNLLKDGLTVGEELEIRADMAKLKGTGYAAYGDKVIAALDNKGRSIIESPEEAKARKVIEEEQKIRKASVERFNKEFAKVDNWHSNPQNSGDSVVKKEGNGGFSIEFKERDKRARIQDSYTAFGMQLTPGAYTLNIDADNLGMVAIFQGVRGEVLGRHAFVNGSQSFVIPNGVNKTVFANVNSPGQQTNKTIIRKATLGIEENMVLAGQSIVVAPDKGK